MSSFKGPYIRATKSPQQYPYMQYPYQNVGTQLTWRGAPPYRSRGADAASLGSNLPVPGGPEVIPANSGYAGYEQVAGLGCAGACGKPCCGGARQAVGDVVPGVPNTVLAVGVGLGVFLFMRRGRRGRR